MSPSPSAKTKLYLSIIAIAAGIAVYFSIKLGRQASVGDMNWREDAPIVALSSLLVLSVLYMSADFLYFHRVKGWKKALFVFLSVCVILSGAEYSLRYFAYIYPPMHRYSPSLLWELTPNLTYLPDSDGRYRVSTNSEGFRCPEISREKAQGEFRIMIVGDSTAFGYPHNDRENFAYFLERNMRMKRPGKNIRVINAAVCGYSSLQGDIFMRERGWSFSPDVLVIAFNNDPTLDFVEDEKRLPSPAVLPLLKFFSKFKLYLAIKELLAHTRINPDDNIEVPPDKGKPRVSKERLGTIYDYMLKEAKARGTRVVVVSLPLRSDMHNFPGVAEYREIMRKKTLEHSFLFLDELGKWKEHGVGDLTQIPQREEREGGRVDLSQSYQETKKIDGGMGEGRRFMRKDSDSMFVDAMHPKVDGHRIIAEDLEGVINWGKK